MQYSNSHLLLVLLLFIVLLHASSLALSNSKTFKIEPLVPDWLTDQPQVRERVPMKKIDASNQFDGKQIVGLALHVKAEPNKPSSYSLVNASLIALNISTGAINTIYGPADSVSPPFGTAYDPLDLRYFFLDPEANFWWIDLTCSCLSTTHISELDLLGQPVMAMQYDNSTASLFTVSLSQRDATVNKQPTDPTIAETNVKVGLSQNEFIPQMFPSASWGKSYAFTSLTIDNNSSLNQVRLWSVDTGLLLQPAGRELSPRCSYISMLAYDSVWDVLVGLVGLADSPNSLPSWVKINATGRMDVLPIDTSYQLTNVFSYTYDSTLHTFFYVSQNLLCTVNLRDGSSSQIPLATSNDNVIYMGLYFQDRPVPSFT